MPAAAVSAAPQAAKDDEGDAGTGHAVSGLNSTSIALIAIVACLALMVLAGAYVIVAKRCRPAVAEAATISSFHNPAYYQHQIPAGGEAGDACFSNPSYSQFGDEAVMHGQQDPPYDQPKRPGEAAFADVASGVLSHGGYMDVSPATADTAYMDVGLSAVDSQVDC